LKIGIDEQIKAAERELAMRVHVYPHRVASGKMKQEAADLELTRIRAILRTLEAVKKAKPDWESHGY
jgi:hypothetical protein